jgi:hypothetical protein
VHKPVTVGAEALQVFKPRFVTGLHFTDLGSSVVHLNACLCVFRTVMVYRI